MNARTLCEIPATDKGESIVSSVHDNEILSYEIDLNNKRIVLHTLYESKSLIEHTDVIFDGVLCHMFEHQLSGSIILAINEYELEYFF